MLLCWRRLLLLLLFSGVLAGFAGGSGLNVILVVNQNSTNSVALANQYREMRNVPPQNVLRISWTGGNIQWTSAEFNSILLNPLLAMVSARGLTNQATSVLLSMDIPYKVVQDGGVTTSGVNSTTSVLYYGFKPDYPPHPVVASCSLPNISSNSFAGSEMPFSQAPPSTAPTNSFLAMMLTASNLVDASQFLTRAVAGDASAPAFPFVFDKGADRFRNLRFYNFQDAMFNLRLRGLAAYQTNLPSLPSLPGPVMGFQNGQATVDSVPGLFAPGAMADTLTSYAGSLFESTGQTPLLAYLAGGAAGSYGTVVEPCNYLEKFSSPHIFFYQVRGFSLAECYYMGVTNPYQGLLVGEPLAAPFARKPLAAWNTLPAGALLSGTTNLLLTVTAPDASRPVAAADLFIDGTFFKTITNLGPVSGNKLSVTIRGYPTNYTVPANATLSSIATALAARINTSAYATAAKVHAYPVGDRIELRGTDITKTGAQVSISTSSAANTGAYLGTQLATAGASLVDSTAQGIRSYMITNAPAIGDWLEVQVTKTNSQVVTVAVTNTAPGTNLYGLATSLFNAVNTHAALIGSDGVVVEDINMHEEEPYRTYVYGVDDHSGEFNIRPRSKGWTASQVQVRVRGSAIFQITPSGVQRLDENIAELQPRQHLYVAAGLSSAPVQFPLNTALLSDGAHDLTAVAYEGSHVRVQGHATQSVVVTNTPLSGSLQLVYGGTNTDISATLQFRVTGSGAPITRLELFSTGGSLTNVAGQSTATFSIPGSRLGPGLHPFYAIVTAGSGAAFRTATQSIRLLGPEPAYTIKLTGANPPVLSWPATAGRAYDILSGTNPAGPLQWKATLIPTNSAAQWTDPSPSPKQSFYRVETSN